jgi:hypothetical protein
MKRRTVLNTIGTGFVGLAGCAALGEEPESTSTPTATQTDTPTPESTTTPSPEPTPTPRMDQSATAKYREPDNGEPIVPNPPNAYRTEDIGSRENVDNPDENLRNGVYLFQRQEARVVVEVQVVDERADTVRLHGVYELPADRSLKINLNEPSDYAVNIYDHPREQGWTLNIPRGSFDCNSKGHYAYGVAGGDFRWNISQTLRECDS